MGKSNKPVAHFSIQVFHISGNIWHRETLFGWHGKSERASWCKFSVASVGLEVTTLLKMVVALRRTNIATEWEADFGAFEVMHAGKVAVARSLGGGTRGWSLNKLEGLWNPLAGFRSAVEQYKSSDDQS